MFSGEGVTRLREYLNRESNPHPEETEATMYDDDEELDEDEGQMTGLMHATGINDNDNDNDDEYMDVPPQ